MGLSAALFRRKEIIDVVAEKPFPLVLLTK
jgi:hypothetical protein